ncbi:MAG: ribosome-associated translation inhibitor RaiA [Fibrobacterales bacterium]|nr:ribosome-associated translation inhibitor RaiA [Fibrobacterales bacterium]
MNIQVTARHFHASATLNQNVREKIEKLEKFHHGITDVVVVLDEEKERVRIVELSVNIPEKTISATAQEETMHAAIDAAVAKIQRMLVKENAKQKEFRAVPLADAVN